MNKSKQQPKKENPKYCYICGEEILPWEKKPEIIKTKRGDELYIHPCCVPRGRV